MYDVSVHTWADMLIHHDPCLQTNVAIDRNVHNVYLVKKIRLFVGCLSATQLQQQHDMFLCFWCFVFFSETEGFKIDTMGTYHGMTLKSVTVGTTSQAFNHKARMRQKNPNMRLCSF